MNITYRQMQKEDIERVTPLFIEYWNGMGNEWTSELVYSRVWQVLGSPDAYCMMAEPEGRVKEMGAAMEEQLLGKCPAYTGFLRMPLILLPPIGRLN